MTAPTDPRQAEWAQRVDYYAREAVDKTRPFADALVAMIDPPSGARVLDVATGPGVAAIEAAKRIGPTGSVIAADFIPHWEPHVVRAMRDSDVANVAFRTMPADALDLPDASMDIVLCQFGLMFVPDPSRALVEMRRVLRPGGTLGVGVWSVAEKVGLFLMSRILGAVLPPPPGDPPPSPLSMAQPGLIEGLVLGAGFENLTVERVTRSFTLSDAEAAWREWSQQPDSPAAAGLASLSGSDRDRVRQEVIAALEMYRRDDVIAVESEAILVTAVKPGERRDSE